MQSDCNITLWAGFVKETSIERCEKCTTGVTVQAGRRVFSRFFRTVTEKNTNFTLFAPKILTIRFCNDIINQFYSYLSSRKSMVYIILC